MRPSVHMASALVLLLSVHLPAQELKPGIEFLNERMWVRDSELFDDGSFIDSGVGLRFGINKKLAYFAGEYEEAVELFEEAVRSFRFKAEIWVYLARSYFYSESPDAARQALQRAAAVMPDLDADLWQPLIASLEQEIRQRAVRQQAQVDFYTTDQEQLLSLFRLYLFLQDHEGALGVVGSAHERSHMLLERARMVSGISRRNHIAQAELWTQLGERLALELQGLGVEVPPAPTPIDLPREAAQEDLEEAERIRVLQLRVDFYRTGIGDYDALFTAYMDLGDTERARVVVAALRQKVQHLEVLASVAPTATELATIRSTIDEFERVGDSLEVILPVPAATPSGTE